MLPYLQDHKDRYRQISVHTLRTEDKWQRTCTWNDCHTVLMP